MGDVGEGLLIRPRQPSRGPNVDQGQRGCPGCNGEGQLWSIHSRVTSSAMRTSLILAAAALAAAGCSVKPHEPDPAPVISKLACGVLDKPQAVGNITNRGDVLHAFTIFVEWTDADGDVYAVDEVPIANVPAGKTVLWTAAAPGDRREGSCHVEHVEVLVPLL